MVNSSLARRIEQGERGCRLGDGQNDMQISADLIATLRDIDTPTICNAIEVIEPSRRTVGFNRTPLVCPFPDMKPAVGFARTAVIRCSAPCKGDRRSVRLAYYEYIERGPRPSIVVIQDEDPERGVGAFWGEVQTNIHRALDCAGVITDGAVRDIAQMARGFFVLAGSIMPSHVHAEIVAFDVPVTVAGMSVAAGDLIHADRHGAVVIPQDVAAGIPAAADLLIRREKVILDACRSGHFSTEDIRTAFARIDEIH
jgi:regulator of RNase E activity RraA